MEDSLFIRIVQDHFLRNRRDFSWRSLISPYRVHVSEMMLQQTQTARVAPAFEAFVGRFPDYSSLASASLPEVIDAWQGLGYNRRAKFLKHSAEMIVAEHGGSLPVAEAVLKGLPGIGPNTAASILAFAFNLPTIFIETNIRTVFLHHYFPEQSASDKEIMPLVSRTLDVSHPREWYWALMDYGVHLKKTCGNASKRSSHYQVQSRFKGSVRQVRGEILRILLVAKQDGSALNTELLSAKVEAGLQALPGQSDNLPLRLAQAIAGLTKDGLVAEQAGYYRLAD